MQINQILSQLVQDQLTEDQAAEFSRTSSLRVEQPPLLIDGYFREITGLLDDILGKLASAQMCVAAGSEQSELISRLRKLVNCSRTQYCQLSQIIAKGGEPEFYKRYLQIYESFNFTVKVENKDKLNFYFIAEVAETEKELLVQLLKKSAGFEEKVIANLKKGSACKQIPAEYHELIIGCSKLRTLVTIFPYACAKSNSDLFCQPKDSPRWLKLFSRGERIKPNSDAKKDLERIKEYLMKLNATYSKIYLPKGAAKPGAEKSAQNFFDIVSFFVNTEKARSQALLTLAEPDPSFAKQVWNLTEEGVAKHFFNLAGMFLKYHEVVYLPYHYLSFSKELVLLMQNKGRLNQQEKLQTSPPLIHDTDGYFKQMGNKEPYKSDKSSIVKVRVICACELKRREKEGEKSMLDKLITNLSGPRKLFKTVVLHIHGGGFISMSTKTHLAYTRVWAKELQVPIFSVEYRKSPEHPYPSGLDDVWQAYNWILDYAPLIYSRFLTRH